MTKYRSQSKEFDIIFAGNYGRLYMYALHLVNDSEAAKDLVSDVFGLLWENFSLVDKSTIKSYLTVSVRNKCIDYIRHKEVASRYTQVYQKEMDLFYSDYRPDEETDRLIKEMLGHLPQLTRQILEECYLNQLKYSEVAEKMNVSPNTVKKHISKALKTLRSKFNGENKLTEGPDDEPSHV